jgi:hypothetical protein
MADNILTDNLSVPLNSTTAANIDIDTHTGNLTIDRLLATDGVLASGTLEYFEDQGLPIQSVSSDNGQTTLSVKGGGGKRSWFHLPWEVCNGAFEWQVHLNPAVPSDITAHSGGGNVRLDLTGMAVTHVSADTGGGNMDVVLPDNTANLAVTARTGAGNVTVDLGSGISGTGIVEAHSGAGNVTVRVPVGIAARIHAHSGLGKATVDPRFIQMDRDTYESPDYASAAGKLDLTARSGAGNVIVSAK